MTLEPTPSDLLIPRLRSTHRAVDSNGFFDVVNTALQLHLATEKTDRQLFYAHSFPKVTLGKADQPFGGVIFRVASSVMAATDNSGSRVPRNPQLREIRSDDSTKGYKIVTIGWRETLTVEFKICTGASDTRGQLVQWFHRFLMRYAFPLKYFGSYGIDKFQFVGRGEDGFESLENQTVYFGTLTYQCQLECLDSYSERIFDSLTFNASAGNELLTFNIPGNQT